MAVDGKSAVPMAVPLPDGPPDGAFTAANWKMLMSIMDTVIPSIRREAAGGSTDQGQSAISDKEYIQAKEAIQHVVDAPNGQQFDEYLEEKASDIPAFEQLLKRTLCFYARDDARKGLALVMSTLDTRVGSLMLTGSSTPFYEQPQPVREAILERWRTSYLPPLNVIWKQMTQLAKNHWLKTSPQFLKLSGFPVVPDHYDPPPTYGYDFMQFGSGSEPEEIETDVVIIGSGCGGAVAAKNLSEAGHRVVVVDKAYHFAANALPMSELAGGVHLFENGGVDTSDDVSMTIVAGSAWGGGGTVNWSASLQTQGFVRKEWAQDRGLTFFETAEFQNCLDRVCHRMGVSCEHIRHNHGNEVLLEGSRKLGYTAKAVPQNTGGTEHYCGHCTLGCGAGQKEGPVNSWLPDAAKAGTKFVEGFQAEHVIFEQSSGTKRAVGVKGTWTSRNSQGGVDGPLANRMVREVTIKAKKVVVACGSLWSPILLLNSGLRNRQIGRNLYLHPCGHVAGVWKEDVRPWEGGILTTVCSSFENLDGHGHGTKLEATCMLPSWSASLLNWESGLQFKTLAMKYRHMNSYIAICRERDPGRVYPDPVTSKPRYAYTPSTFDRAHILEGIVALAKMCYVTGALEIHPAIAGLQPYIRTPDEIASIEESEGDDGITSPRFLAWLDSLRRHGNKPPSASFASAHQMGSNRMSAVPKDGVVDPKGRVWGTEGLYVCDASVFPSASGVNPMVTNMAISDWISRGISKDLSTAASRNSGGDSRL